MTAKTLQFNYFRALKVSGAVFVLFIVSFINTAQAITVTPRIEINVNPGETIKEVFKIRNEERQSRTYYTSVENFESQDESGTPRFSLRKEDLATWINLPEIITIGPGEVKEVEFTIITPKEAEPGGHFSAIFLQTSPPSNNGGDLAISAKLGSLILLRVNGDFQQGGGVLEFATKFKKHFFTSLPIEFYYRFQNDGDDHLHPVGDVLITNSIGRTTKILPANPVDGSVLPKSIRRFETKWLTAFGPIEEDPLKDAPTPAGKGYWENTKYEWHNFALGKYSAKLKVVYGTKELKSSKSEFVFYVLPWHLLLLILLGATILFIILRFSLRRYNRYIIANARRQLELSPSPTKAPPLKSRKPKK